VTCAFQEADLQLISQVADLLTSGKRELTLEDITSVLPFALDKFQAQSVEIILRGSSVVAPTGAGKTVIAEAATIAMLARYLLPLPVERRM
jgi:superfamily II RNA helicase